MSMSDPMNILTGEMKLWTILVILKEIRTTRRGSLHRITASEGISIVVFKPALGLQIALVKYRTS